MGLLDRYSANSPNPEETPKEQNERNNVHKTAAAILVDRF